MRYLSLSHAWLAILEKNFYPKLHLKFYFLRHIYVWLQPFYDISGNIELIDIRKKKKKKAFQSTDMEALKSLIQPSEIFAGAIVL
jgi:hypothetical protein